MPDFKTELETGETPNATVLESGDGLNRTALEPGAPVVRGPGLIVGDVFRGYRVVKWMEKYSAEADLYLVEKTGDGMRFVLKLYHRGRQPKTEVLDKIGVLRREHIVEIVERDRSGEQFYEIQEFVEHGSLADMMVEGGLPEAKVIEALREIAAALAHLHEVDILHRDIKPSNILVRSKEPNLDLVLTDFGLSRVTRQSFVEASAVDRTPAYSAPEAGTRGLVKKSDWWSVGIILIEMLTGRHPFFDILDNDLAIGLHLATKPVPIPGSLSKDWQMIIKGLLTRDPRKRWGFEQVSQWLEGGRDIPVYFEKEVIDYRPYKFDKREFFTPAELAVALAEKWDEAVKRVGRSDILKWVRDDLKDADMANALQDIADDRDLSEYQRVTVTLLVLNPQMPAVWEDAVITLEWMQQNPKVAVALLESSVPKWLQALRKDPWMMTLKERRRQIWDSLRQVPKINRDLAERLILGAAEVAHAEAKSVRDTIFSSESPIVDQALHKLEMDDADAILLASCDRTLLWSKEQEAVRKVEDAQRQREIEIAERERRRKSELEEEERSKNQAREERFNLANILGWASLGTLLLGPLYVLGLIMCIVSAYFIVDYWRHASHREALKGGHKVACGVVVIVPVVICIAMAASASNAASQRKAAADLQATQQRASTEPTAFTWQIWGSEDGAQPINGKVNITLWQQTVIIDKMTATDVQFHIIDGSKLWLYIWKEGHGCVGLGTEKPWTFNIHNRSQDEIIVATEDQGTQKSHYEFFRRNYQGFHLFQPEGWILYEKTKADEEAWEPMVTFSDPGRNPSDPDRAEISPTSIRLQWHFENGQPNVIFSWNRNDANGLARVKDEQSDEVSQLIVDSDSSSFVNGPIYLTKIEPSGNRRSFLLVRF